MTEDFNEASFSDALRGGTAAVEIVRRIGSGATGTVYEVRRPGEERSCALKVATESPDGLQVRRREADALQSLRHDHLVEMHGWASSEQGLGLLMEYLPDGTAQQLIARKGAVSPGAAVTLVAPIAAALAYLHEQGAAHGDVTPGNILFTAEGRPKLGELGFSALLGRSDLPTRHPGFTAPEVRDPSADKHAADERKADVYALGALMRFALTGAGHDAASGRRALPSLPEEASNLLERALDVDPGRRPTAEEFWIGIFAAGEPQPLDLADSPSRTAATGASEPVPGVPAQPAQRRSARRAAVGRPGADGRAGRRWKTGAVAAGVVVLAAASIAWAAGNGVLTTDTTGSGATAENGGRSTSSSSAPAPETSSQTVPAGVADIVQTLAERRSEALTQLSPDLLADVYASEEAASADREVIDALVAQGRRYEGLSITMSDAVVLAQDDDGQRVRVLSRILPYSVVDESGAQVETVAEAEEQDLILQLRSTADGWRIASLEAADGQ
ncbi:serine/threonine-protein kinase [Zhihengliuella salsuginis]|nr:serine/threonine-protein kinase [Zhihengliuella salsuginis]